MSETSTLISCTGKITRAELVNLPTPPSTETHIPIPHAAVVETLVETLNHRHIAVVGEEFAVSTDGMEMFGVLDLEAGFEGCRFAIGIRNANNKRFARHARLDFECSCVTTSHSGVITPPSWPNTRSISRSRTLCRSVLTGCNEILNRCSNKSNAGERSSYLRKRQS